MTHNGLYLPLITPFDADGGVAYDALAALTHDVLDAGASGIVALGTTGEPSALTTEERHRVVDVIARICRERDAPLVVGANTVDVAAALRRWPEVTAALSVVPPFLRPGEDGVIAHFTTLAAASAVPIVVYHVPYRTGQHLSAAAIRRLAAIDGVVGVKYAPGGIDADAIDLMADPPAGFAILGGHHPFISPLLALGAHGGILASAHIETALFADLVAAWQAGDTLTARSLGHRLAPLSSALFAEPNPTVIKAVLHVQGRIPTPLVRLPLVPARPASIEEALQHLSTVIGTPIAA